MDFAYLSICSESGYAPRVEAFIEIPEQAGALEISLVSTSAYLKQDEISLGCRPNLQESPSWCAD
jgi:hypothetical protein